LFDLESFEKNIGNWRVGLSVSVASARLEIDAEAKLIKSRVKDETELLNSELTSIENKVTSHCDQVKEAVKLQTIQLKDYEKTLSSVIAGNIDKTGRLFMEIEQTLEKWIRVPDSCQYPFKSVSYNSLRPCDKRTSNLLGKVVVNECIAIGNSELEPQERGNGSTNSLDSKVNDTKLTKLELRYGDEAGCGVCRRQFLNERKFHNRNKESEESREICTNKQKKAKRTCMSNMVNCFFTFFTLSLNSRF
jgi:hypothetical protein